MTSLSSLHTSIPCFSIQWLAIIIIIAAVGLTLVKVSVTEAVARFLHKRLKLSTALLGLGVSAGFVLLPSPSEYLFTKFKFHNAMFILTPTMLMHLFGVLLYNQNSTDSSSTQTTRRESLSTTLSNMATNPMV